MGSVVNGCHRPYFLASAGNFSGRGPDRSSGSPAACRYSADYLQTLRPYLTICHIFYGSRYSRQSFKNQAAIHLICTVARDDDVFCISCCDSSPTLSCQKCLFDPMPQFIQFLVVFTLNSSIFARWNDRFHSCLFRFLDNLIRVIAPVCQKNLGFHAVNQGFSLLIIRGGTFCNKDSDRHTMRHPRPDVSWYCPPSGLCHVLIAATDATSMGMDLGVTGVYHQQLKLWMINQLFQSLLPHALIAATAKAFMGIFPVSIELGGKS